MTVSEENAIKELLKKLECGNYNVKAEVDLLRRAIILLVRISLEQQGHGPQSV